MTAVLFLRRIPFDVQLRTRFVAHWRVLSCAACAGRPINLSSVVCVCVGLMEAGREEERWTEAMCVNDRSAWKIFLLD